MRFKLRFKSMSDISVKAIVRVERNTLALLRHGIAPPMPQAVKFPSRTHYNHKHKTRTICHQLTALMFIHQTTANISHPPEWEVIYILGLHNEGLSPPEIAIWFGWDKSTITHLLRNYLRETFTGLHSRPEQTHCTSEDDRMLVCAALANRTVVTDITNSTAPTISPTLFNIALKKTEFRNTLLLLDPFLPLSMY